MPDPRILSAEEIDAINSLRHIQPPAISDLESLCWMAREYLKGREDAERWRAFRERVMVSIYPLDCIQLVLDGDCDWLSPSEEDAINESGVALSAMPDLADRMIDALRKEGKI